MKKQSGLTALLLVCALLCCGCSAQGAAEPTPTPQGAKLQAAQVKWPKDKLTLNENGIPQLDVYVVDEKAVRTMDVETYVQGVLAGEMKNDWPMEALKAQAILARTFVLKFIEEKQSKYPNADISTDIEEAQAYDASAINDRIRQAVTDTSGLVLVSEGALPYAWFHAHSGGMTEGAKVGLGWDKEEPSYTQSVKGTEPDSAKDSQELADAQSWSASFTFEEFESACRKQGAEIELSDNPQLTIKERGEGGRAAVIAVGDQTVDAAELRIALGSTKMRSTLLSSLRADKGKIIMAGKGYGHGVGMSQWGAYGMAESGKGAVEIVKHYFRNITVDKLW